MKRAVKKRGGALIAMMLAVCILLTGCRMSGKEQVKLENLDFTILGDELVPEELAKILEGKKKEPFQITYRDAENLYICVGYGEQKSGGYSIVVNDLYLTEEAIYVDTSLLGPEKSASDSRDPSYPMIVMKTKLREEGVIFQ